MRHTDRQSQSEKPTQKPTRETEGPSRRPVATRKGLHTEYAVSYSMVCTAADALIWYAGSAKVALVPCQSVLASSLVVS